MKKLVLFLVVLCSSAALRAQGPSAPAFGYITAATTNASCIGQAFPTNGGAVDQPINGTTGAVGVSVTGTWSATLNIQLSVDHGKTWTASGSTFTANQQSIITTTGYSDLCVFASAYTSGTAVVTFATALPAPPTAGTGAAASQVQGAGAAGSAPTGNPVLIAGQDSTQTTRVIETNSSGVLALTQYSAGVDGITNNDIAPFQAANSAGVPAIPYIAPLLFNGASWDRPIYCSNTAVVNVAATTTQIIAASGSTKVRVCSFVLSGNATAGSFAIEYGTGTNCGTGTTSLSGTLNVLGTTAAPVSYNGGGTAPLTTPASQAVCVLATTTTVTGFLTWEQH